MRSRPLSHKGRGRRVLSRIDELEGMERSDHTGHLGWFYMKVKANSDTTIVRFRFQNVGPISMRTTRRILESIDSRSRSRRLPSSFETLACGEALFKVRAVEASSEDKRARRKGPQYSEPERILCVRSQAPNPDPAADTLPRPLMAGHVRRLGYLHAEVDD